jgi:hypothetical protein
MIVEAPESSQFYHITTQSELKQQHHIMLPVLEVLLENVLLLVLINWL